MTEMADTAAVPSWGNYLVPIQITALPLPKHVVHATFKNSVQFSSVAQSCPTLCDPRNRSMPGLPVHHQLPESTQTHVHCVGDAIWPSHPLTPTSPPALNLSQHQGLFKWVSSLHQVAKVLEASVLPMNIQDWFPLGIQGSHLTNVGTEA